MNDFFSYVYETIFQFYRDGFSPDLLDNSMYGLVGSVTVIWALLISATYYFLINRSSWAHWYRWLLFGLSVACLPPFFFAWLHPQAVIDVPYETGDYIAFGFWTGVLAFLSYTILGMLTMRWFSRDCKSVPFPK